MESPQESKQKSVRVCECVCMCVCVFQKERESGSFFLIVKCTQLWPRSNRRPFVVSMSRRRQHLQKDFFVLFRPTNHFAQELLLSLSLFLSLSLSFHLSFPFPLSLSLTLSHSLSLYLYTSLSHCERVCVCPSCFTCLLLSWFFPIVRQK